MNTIETTSNGTLTQHEEFEDWWESKPVKIPFFNHVEVVITFSNYLPGEDANFLEEADAVIRAFLQKGKADKLAISHLVHKNCMDFLHAIGFEEEDKHLWEIEDKDKIWKYIQLEEIFVSRNPYKREDIYVQLCCECDWEQEHGLQIIFKEGKEVTRVSAQDGHLT
jgi:hypothetical protein